MADCPIHRLEMRRLTHTGGHAEFVCPQCIGVWLDGALVQRMIGETPAPERIRASGSPRRLACPVDGTSLVAFHHHGIEIDLCPQCTGVWLDSGERDRILQDRQRPRQANSLLRNIASEGAGALEVVGLAGEAISSLLEFIGDALSGL